MYIMAWYEVQKLISFKKFFFFENRLNYSIGKPKELWKSLNSLSLPIKTSVCRETTLKVKNTTSFGNKSTLGAFKNYYSALADNLLEKLPTPSRRHTFSFVTQYYRHFIYSIIYSIIQYLFNCFQIFYYTMPQLFDWSFRISLSKQFKSKI